MNKFIFIFASLVFLAPPPGIGIDATADPVAAAATADTCATEAHGSAN